MSDTRRYPQPLFLLSHCFMDMKGRAEGAKGADSDESTSLVDIDGEKFPEYEVTGVVEASVKVDEVAL